MEEIKIEPIPVRTLDEINVFSACKIKLTPKMIKIENDRMEKIKNIIPRWSDGFNVHIMSKEVKVPIKFMVQNQMYNYKNKF
jgi:hypothetical protein